MAEIHYPDYRMYVASRIEVNDAMMALLAGSRLAARALQLTAGSTATLSQLFPEVEHIARFNLRSDSARELLHDADKHIASVSVPYALATHEEFVKKTLDLLEADGKALILDGKPAKRILAWNMHAVLFETCGFPEPKGWLQTFHVIREARNCIIHGGGAASTALSENIAKMDATSRDGWKRLNDGDEPEDLICDGQLALTAEHVFTAFAATKAIGREINAALASALSVESWARMAVTDFAESTKKTKNSSGWRRSLVGFARINYANAGLTQADLERAARILGAWTLSEWTREK